MEFLIVIVVFVVARKLLGSVFYSREDWEREIDKYNQKSENKSAYDLPMPLHQSTPSIEMVKNTLMSRVISPATKIVPLVSQGMHKVKKFFNIYEKIDKKAKEIKINTRITGSVVIFWLVIVCLLAIQLRNYVNFLKNISFYNPLDDIVALTSLFLILLVVYLLIRDIGGIISIKKIEDTKATIDDYVKANKCRELKEYLLSLKISATKQKELKSEFKGKNTALDVIVIYERIVLKEKDEKVHKVIRKYRNKIIIGNGVSGSSLLDFAVNLYCFYKILYKTASIYEVKLGLISLFRVFCTGCLVCYAVSKITNLLGEAVKKFLEGAVVLQVGFDFVSGLLKAFVQGITSGLSIEIYGYWLKYALRPSKAYNLSMKEQTRQILKKSSDETEEK